MATCRPSSADAVGAFPADLAPPDPTEQVGAVVGDDRLPAAEQLLDQEVVERQEGLAEARRAAYVRPDHGDAELLEVVVGAAEEAELGEKREAVLAVTIPEKPGSFRKFCSLLGPRNVTEFNYRISDSKEAHVFVGLTTSARGGASRATARRGPAAADARALARLKVQPFGGTLVRARVFGPDGRTLPLLVRGGRLTPRVQLMPGERVSVEVVIRRPGWLAWALGSKHLERLTLRAPVAEGVDERPLDDAVLAGDFRVGRFDQPELVRLHPEIVRGAWSGGWAWERVTPLLEAAGHDVVTAGLDPVAGWLPLRTRWRRPSESPT